MDPADRTTKGSAGDDAAGGADSEFVAGFESVSEPPAARSPRETPSAQPLDSEDWTPPHAARQSDAGAFTGARGGEDLPDFTPPDPREAVKPAPRTAGHDPADASAGDGDRPRSHGRTMPAAPSEPVNVDNLDHAMAGEIDDLLHDDADTVEEVLMGMQDDAADEPAVTSDSRPAPVPEAASSHAAASTPPAPPGAGPVGDFESFESFESIDDLLEEDLAAAPSKRIISTEPLVAARPVTALAIDARTPPEVETPKSRKQSLLPASPVGLIVLVLRVLNYPLRLVPPRLRLVVDLIALTLVFWVPIVWAIALFVVGR